MKRTKFLTLAALFFITGCATTRMALQREEPLPQGKRIHFDFGKHSIPDSDRAVLESVAGDLKKSGKAIVILEGHTDSVGSDRYNEILAELRARAVRVALRDLGVDPERATVISKGKRDPAVPGNTPEARQANRRVEIIYELGLVTK